MGKKNTDIVKKADTVTFATAVVVESDYVRFAAYRDDIDPDEVDESRMISYDPQGDDPWSQDDVDTHVIAMCLWPNAKGKKRAYVAMSWEGQVEIVLQGADFPSNETIQDAGLHGDWSKDHGYVMDVAAIGKTLFVCGDAGQIYKRLADDKWVHVDEGLLIEGSTNRCFMAIDGLSESSIYVVGVDGEIFHGDGKQWRKIDIRTDEQLLCIRVFDEKDVVIGGSNGTLLVGNAADGFRDISSVDDNMRISSVERFQGQLYAASNLGLLVYDEERRNLRPVITGLQPELQDANVIQARDEVVWSIGFKDIAYFDGDVWKRVDYVSNPKIG